MTELIDALRCCGVECKCYGCPYENKTGMNEKFKCIHMVLSDAADALERLMANVPVVRCGECKYAIISERGIVSCHKVNGYMRVGVDFYCADGERKDGEHGDLRNDE